MAPDGNVFSDTSRTKRLSSGGRGSRGTGVVYAPRPVQTSSLKAETGQDLSTVLVNSKSTSKWSCWGSAGRDEGEKLSETVSASSDPIESTNKVESDQEYGAEESEAVESACGSAVGLPQESGADTNEADVNNNSLTDPREPAQMEMPSEKTESVPVRRKLGGIRSWSDEPDPAYDIDQIDRSRNQPEKTRTVKETTSWTKRSTPMPRYRTGDEQDRNTTEKPRFPAHQTVKRVIIQKPPTNSEEGKRFSVVKQEGTDLDAKSRPRGVSPSEEQCGEPQGGTGEVDTAVSESDSKATQMAPSEDAGELLRWEDPSKLCEDEKEKKRKALALEQQQLVLRQVEAARAMRNSKRKPEKQEREPMAKPHPPTTAPVEDETVRAERLQHQQNRLPRTKGVLFRRLADGSLVETDRFGEPLPKTTRDCKDDEPSSEESDPVAAEEKVQNTKETPLEVKPRPFVPAAVPKVSAWTLGPPPSIIGSNSNALAPTTNKDQAEKEKVSQASRNELTKEAVPASKSEGESKRSKDRKQAETKQSKQTGPAQRRKNTGPKSHLPFGKGHDMKAMDSKKGTQSRKTNPAAKRKPRKQQFAASSELRGH